MDKKIIGNKAKRENKTEKMGTKAMFQYFKEQGTPTRKKKTFKEQGNTRESLLGTGEHGHPWEALISGQFPIPQV